MLALSGMSELFWQSSLSEIKQGYVFQESTGKFICLICGESFQDGMIYPDGDSLYEARKFIIHHVATAHQSVFHYLLQLDRKLTGLTEHQKTLLQMFYAGQSDAEVARELNTAASTVRNHRFSLRERQKQAKLFLAIMELLGDQTPRRQAFIEIPRSSRQVDERFAITEEENAEILATYFKQGVNGPLDSFPLRKEKRKVAILRHLVTRFASGRTYTEKEVNAVLQPIYPDYALLRRYLIEYGFMDRTPDGSAYWVKP